MLTYPTLPQQQRCKRYVMHVSEVSVNTGDTGIPIRSESSARRAPLGPSWVVWKEVWTGGRQA